MTTHAELIQRAERMGHDVTPTLSAELRKLAAIPDDVILAKARRVWVEGMAKDYQVQVGLAKIRLENVGPFRAQHKEGLK